MPALTFATAPFIPRGSVDGSLGCDNPILPEDPNELLETGQFHRVPIIIGATNAEGIIVADVALGLLNVKPWMINIAWPLLGPLLVFDKLDPRSISQNEIDVGNIVKGFYVKPFGIVTENNYEQVIQMITDALFQYSAHRTAKIISRFVPQVYQYLFSHKGPYSAIYIADGK